MRFSANCGSSSRTPSLERPLRAVLVLALTLASASIARAGELIVYNLSSRAVMCTVDGYTKATGGDTDIAFRVEPGQRLNIPPSFKSRVLNTSDCGGLKTRAMSITSESPDRVLFINGSQHRVLNALLYASIPTDPKAGFSPLVRWLVQSYQAAHPDVLLNLVIDPAIDVYDFNNLKGAVFSAKGFDIAEIDTVFLKWLKDQGLISPVRITGEEPWSVGKAAVTIDGQAYGIPSWLCSDFVFSTGSDVGGIKTFTDLQVFLAKAPGSRRGLVGDLYGTWTIPALYLQAFVQSHPDMTVEAAAAAKIDTDVIKRVAKFGTYCSSSNLNPCIDGTFHSANNVKDGVIEQDFDAEQAATDLGFSERSFFVAYYQSVLSPLSLAAMPWGDKPDAPRLVYSDAFLTSKAACGNDPCESDAAAFAKFMTAAATKKYIAMATDLPGGDPPRHLLVATKPFYDDKDVKSDPVYAQLAAGFLKGNVRPYLTSFTPQLQYDLLSRICPELKKASSGWKCKVPNKPE